LVNLLAYPGLGSMTAMTVFYPLDTARIRLQVDANRKPKSTPSILAEIAKEEGLTALYRGWFPVISSLCCSNFVYFYTFNSLKTALANGKAASQPGKDLLMGIISGTVNVLLTTPMWVMNTRLKLQGAKFRSTELHQTHYAGIFDAFRQIVKSEGVKALWNGVLPSLILVFNPAVQFMFYEGMKRRVLKKRLLPMSIFLIGAVAKAIAVTATYPLQTVQAMLRVRYKTEGKTGLVASIQSVLQLLKERLRAGYLGIGLYKGLEAKLLQTVLTAALMLVVYEKITAATFKVMGLSRKVKH
uniref:Peroxisomal membrane protein PMP34 n=1 Tax=Erpetoichthys calabaricus TaxID=27687 RepID=A0A8C4T919_ERPCA